MSRVLQGLIFLSLVLGGIFFLYTQTNKQSLPQEISSDKQTAHIACNGQSIPQQTEGPYYKTASPQTTNLYREDIPGERVMLEGYVLDTSCTPIANAWIDFWQANGNGEYDNEGYILRGHQYTDAQGKFILTTVIPGEYPGRTPHIHFKVRATESSPIITSQLYLPDAEQNNADAIFDDGLVMEIRDTDQGKVATYNIIINR